MATEKELHAAMEKLEAHFKTVRARYDAMTEEERVRLGEMLEEFSDRLGGAPKG